MTKVIAVDFDGTITSSGEYTGRGIEHYAVPNEEVVAYIRTMHFQGHKIIIWTCRPTVEYADIRKYCNMHHIPINGINTNDFAPKELKDFGDSPKIYADIYIDDRAMTLTQVSDQMFKWGL